MVTFFYFDIQVWVPTTTDKQDPGVVAFPAPLFSTEKIFHFRLLSEPPHELLLKNNDAAQLQSTGR